ncbi:MAG TPA: PHP domain-containing protein, partial [Phycisphaerae bacterium]|nr:PHP domain-containing protein [Phycisphaerae bacterium]
VGLMRQKLCLPEGGKEFSVVRKVPQDDLVDLHVHSSASDGAYPPREVVERAAEAGLKAIALTDHDTLAGQAEARAAGGAVGLEIVPGVEISTEFERGACHILGYFIEVGDAALETMLEAAREGREVRNREMLVRLNGLGFGLKMEDLVGQAGEGVVTRAHFAAAMLRKGYVASWDEVFEKYLGRGKPAYVERRHVEPEEAIEAIRGAGGLAVLAHPRQLNRGPEEMESWFRRLAAAGLDGLETQSPDHGADEAQRYHEAAVRLGLLETGGTDWHGRKESGIRLGVGRGQMRIRYAVVEAMRSRLAGRRR